MPHTNEEQASYSKILNNSKNEELRDEYYKYMAWVKASGIHSQDLYKAEADFWLQKFAEREQALNVNIGMLRQWLNEDRITDHTRMVTNEDIKHWLNQ